MRTATVALLAALAAAPPLAAQEPTAGDPYTRGDQDALDAAGYRNLGPFAIGGYHGTDDVDALLAPATVHWIETAHFRIGSTLAPYRLPHDQDQRRKVRAELERLRERLPDVDPKTTRLDPWLRTHLIAQRCEDVYTDLQRRLRVRDGDFPHRPQDVRQAAVHMGLGPYLGQTHKYVVLVFEHAHEVAAYAEEHLGQRLAWPQRVNLGRRRPLLFVTSPELGGWLGDDTAMHVHLVYDVVHLLLDGFRGYAHDTPVWFKTGFAQWCARRIDPRYPNFDRPPDGPPKGSLLWTWEPIVERLCRDRQATPLEEMATWRDYEPFAFEDYVVAWSRVAFLMDGFGDDGLRRFVFRLKDPLTSGATPPTWDLVLAKQEEALTEAFGFADWGALDRAWHDAAVGIARAEPASRRRRR